jgi:uncharacterized phage protein gp47/JayE
LNVQLTAYGDKIAELWEFGEEIYHSMYPFSAEDISLDNAVQYGGITRESARPTYYPINCECVDGTVIPKGTMIKSKTNPAVNFISSANAAVTRSAFTAVKIRTAVLQPNYIYSIAVDGLLYSYTSSANPNTAEILNGLKEAVISDKVTADVSGAYLEIKTNDIRTPSNLTLSSNLTTESVTAAVNFESTENGEIILPDGTITEIVTGVVGLLSVSNLSGYIAGNLKESDAELRKSYADKIFMRSLTMVESVNSAILINVQGVSAVAGYENDTDRYDADGRPPHSVEFIVEGGENLQIASQILAKKAAGINTFGDVVIDMTGKNGENIPVRFNRPSYLYVWFKVGITLKKNMGLPAGYADIIKESIIEQVKSLGIAEDIVSQEFLNDIYAQIPGIAYIDIPMFFTHDTAEMPGAYEFYVTPVTVRERAVTDETRIEVLLNG